MTATTPLTPADIVSRLVLAAKAARPPAGSPVARVQRAPDGHPVVRRLADPRLFDWLMATRREFIAGVLGQRGRCVAWERYRDVEKLIARLYEQRGVRWSEWESASVGDWTRTSGSYDRQEDAARRVYRMWRGYDPKANDEHDARVLEVVAEAWLGNRPPHGRRVDPPDRITWDVKDDDALMHVAAEASRDFPKWRDAKYAALHAQADKERSQRQESAAYACRRALVVPPEHAARLAELLPDAGERETWVAALRGEKKLSWPKTMEYLEQREATKDARAARLARPSAWVPDKGDWSNAGVTPKGEKRLAWRSATIQGAGRSWSVYWKNTLVAGGCTDFKTCRAKLAYWLGARPSDPTP